MKTRGAEETRILEEPVRGAEWRSDPMEDKKGGVEERKANKTKRGEKGAGAGKESGGQHIYKINLRAYLQNAIVGPISYHTLRIFSRVIE